VPVTALRAWLDAAGITTGPVFRSILQRRKGQGQAHGTLRRQLGDLDGECRHLEAGSVAGALLVINPGIRET
jgi:hypothetical protein